LEVHLFNYSGTNIFIVLSAKAGDYEFLSSYYFCSPKSQGGTVQYDDSDNFILLIVAVECNIFISVVMSYNIFSRKSIKNV
jgi:hypothetical protein